MEHKIRGRKKLPAKFSECAKNAKSNPKPAEGSLRVWHIPQVPGKAFHWEVDPLSSTPIQDAAEIMKLLARYDLFQYENKIKPDYASAQGLEVYEGGEWVEWSDEDGNDIGDLMREGKL